jgi:uncharacterized protein YcbX
VSAARVTTLSLTPVKGTRLQTVESVELDVDGARDNRRFYVVDERNRMVNSKVLGGLQTLVAGYDAPTRRLTLSLPDGQSVSDLVGDGGDEIETRFFSQPRPARVVDGPWSQAISEQLGQSLRLVDGGPAVDRGEEGAVSLISQASLERLASEAGVDSVDARRFRMLVEIDGIAAHEEDRWVGRSVRVGPAVVRMEGHVGRCLITSRDPESDEIDLPTLDVLRRYRNDGGCTEPLPFGVYGRVLEPGRVSVGDTVSLV